MPNPGDIIATRPGGWTLVYDATAPNGLDLGHVVDPDGTAYTQQFTAAIIQRGYWTLTGNQ